MFITQIYSQIMLGLKQPKKTATFTLISVATDFVFILGTALITRNLHYIVIGVMFSALLQWGYAQYNLGRYFTKVTFDPDYYKNISVFFTAWSGFYNRNTFRTAINWSYQGFSLLQNMLSFLLEQWNFLSFQSLIIL